MLKKKTTTQDEAEEIPNLRQTNKHRRRKGDKINKATEEESHTS